MPLRRRRRCPVDLRRLRRARPWRPAGLATAGSFARRWPCGRFWPGATAARGPTKPSLPRRRRCGRVIDAGVGRSMRDSMPRLRVPLVAAAAVSLAVAATVAGIGGRARANPRGVAAARQPGLRRYRDVTGWRVLYPASYYVEVSEQELGLSIVEVTIANFRPRPGIIEDAYPGGGNVRAVPPLREGGRFPADGIALRVVSDQAAPALCRTPARRARSAWRASGRRVPVPPACYTTPPPARRCTQADTTEHLGHSLVRSASTVPNPPWSSGSGPAPPLHSVTPLHG